MKKLSQPSKEFDLSPPSYREIASIIRKMKSSGSPCPFDQITLEKLKVLSAATFLLFSSCNSLKSNFTAHKARKQLAVLIMSMLYSSKINSAAKQHQVIAYLSSCNQTCYLLFSYCKINCNYEFIKPCMHILYTYYNLPIAI